MTKDEIEKLLPDALGHFYDFSYLGTHPLAQLSVISRLIVHDQTPLTHVDRGRALSRALQVAVDELKPNEGQARNGREARFYSILHQEYCEGKENSEVALNLAISERTFYRDRKRALRTLAQILTDMESQG